MPDPQVFPDASPATPTPASVTPAPVVLPDSVKDYVGEGKKYASVEEALKSIPHAQKHIEDLKQAADAVRAEAARLKAENEAHTAYIESLKQAPKPSDTPVGLDASSVEAIVERKLTSAQELNKQQANQRMVAEALTERFGDKAKEVFEKRGAELGIDLNALARVSPQAALELFPKAETSPNLGGSLNTVAGLSIKQPPNHKPVMFGASTEDLRQAWRNAKPS